MRQIILKILLGARGLLAIYTLTLACLDFENRSVQAQVSTAITHTTGVGDLGTRTISQGQTTQIIGGTRSDQGSGSSLFHSFNQFSVGDGHTAQFLNTAPSLRTNNILSRVTGGDHSSIFGTIDTTSYPGANLFFMNPAGIVFGPNAALHVDGAVAFTTADYLRLAQADGSNAGIFRADPRATPQLSSAPIAAFGFLGDHPAAIIVNGTALTLEPGQSFSLIGGNITIQSTMLGDKADPITPGNQIFMASAASPGEILVGTLASAANINGELLQTLGTVHISQGSKIDTSNHDGGTIRIRGGRLTIDTSVISASTGNIDLDATSIQITDATQIKTKPTISANAGHITMKASGDIDLDSAIVQSLSGTSPGGTGNITISSSQGTVNIVDSLVTSQVDISGNAGAITLNAPHGDILISGTELFNRTDGTGTLGGIQITTNNLVLNSSIIGGNNFARQVAGNLIFTLEGRLSLSGESQISTGTLGQAEAADLIIRSRDILLTNDSSLVTSTRSSGNAGQLHLLSDSLRLTDGGRLSSRSFANREAGIPSGRGGTISIEGYKNPGTSMTIDGEGSGIFSGALGTGPAGNINVKATSVTLQNGGTISASTTGTSATATGGSIIVNVTNQVTLKNGASITASSTGPADAGNISVDAGRQLDIQDSLITTEAREASGGNIDIKAVDLIRVANGSISSSVQGGPSTAGGNITIDPKTVVLQDAKILASAQQGNGGNITITTPLFLADPRSVVDASSQFGLNGSVTIQSPTSNLSETVGQLASKTSPPQVLLQNRCVALAGGEQSTFILTGRDILPSQPGGWLSSPVAMEHWTGDKIEEHASGLMVRRVEPRVSSPELSQVQGTEVLSLRRLTPSGFLVRSFADRALTGCRS